MVMLGSPKISCQSRQTVIVRSKLLGALQPKFPIKQFTPSCSCPHRGSVLIQEGKVICMVCNKTPFENHPELQIRPTTKPRSKHKFRPRGAVCVS